MNPNTNDIVRSLAISGSNIYVVSDFTTMNRFPQTYFAVLPNTTTEEDLEIDNIPTGYNLLQNYSNPFSPATTSYVLCADVFVSLELFNIVGEKVATLISQEMKSGYNNYQLMSDNYNLSAGIYFYRLTSNNFSFTKKLVLLK